MGNHEYTPPSRRNRKADPKRVKKIIEGGKKADQIRQKAVQHHHEIDVPKAEQELEEALKELNGEDK